jgi:uncharacterized membrane protein YgcG
MEGISPQGSRNLGLQILLSAVCLSALTTLSVAADLSPYYLENRTMISAPTQPHAKHRTMISAPTQPHAKHRTMISAPTQPHTKPSAMISAPTPAPHQPQQRKGYLVVVVDSTGCAQSRAFFLPAGPSGVLASRLAGGYLQVVSRMGYADSPPIAVPKEIHDEPNADIFDIIHEAYERHRGQMMPGITPEEAKEAERQLNLLPPPQSYPDPTQDPDFQPLPEKQSGQGQGGQAGGGQGGGGQAGGGQGGGGQALVLNASQKRLIRRYPLMLNQCFRLVSSPQKGKS